MQDGRDRDKKMFVPFQILETGHHHWKGEKSKSWSLKLMKIDKFIKAFIHILLVQNPGTNSHALEPAPEKLMELAPTISLACRTKFE